MKATKVILAMAILVVAAGARSAFADPFTTNITIFDGHVSASHTGVGVGGEDNETEPGTLEAQRWDLEAMYQSGAEIAMVGGFNFKDGESFGSAHYDSGDILIDIHGDAMYGAGSGTASYATGDPNTLGWDFAIRMDFSDDGGDADASTFGYDVFALDGTSTFYAVTDIPVSNPWKVKDHLGVIASGVFKFHTGVPGGPLGLLAWESSDVRYAVSGFDLAGFGVSSPFIAAYTYECGNDKLVGYSPSGVSVPEPATLLLFGIGLAGIAFGARRKL